MKNTYLSLFIEIGKYSIATILLVAAGVTSATIASSKVSKASNEPMAVQSINFNVQVPRKNFCPSESRMTGWIRTSKPGEIRYHIAKRDGTVSETFDLEAKKSMNGGLGVFSHEVKITKSINSEYRIVASTANSHVASNWMPLRANCNINLKG